MLKNALVFVAMIIIANPLWAASSPFFSLRNTDFVVTISFILFALVLIYLKVPSMLGKMLDQRAVSIKSDLEEAQTILASYERQQKEVSDQAARIVDDARNEAKEAANQAQIDLEKSVQRRLSAAEEKIASAQASAEREVRNTAINVAVAAATEILRSQMSADMADQLTENAISEVQTKFH
ncbi:ATP F0F1 synthase subunit B [Paracoccaceae bacterium]|nr:ATP F0F1 synthase subunit B [Paracoccaceae bacterium]